MINHSIEDDVASAKRGIAWIRFEEALKINGCPICTQISRSERKYIENLLYEYVLDLTVRKKLHQTYGFCTRHASMAIEAERALNSDGLHLSTMFETVVEENLLFLKSQRDFLKSRSQKKSLKVKGKQISIVKSDKCFVCEHVIEIEDILIHTFKRFSRDAEFLDLYKRSNSLLCFKHLQILVENSVDTRFLDISIAKLERLKSNLRSFIQKHSSESDHRYSDEEKDSFIAVVKFFSGGYR